MEEYMWIVWLVIFVLTIIIEALTADLVSIFFTAGSIVSLIISFIDGVDYKIEIIVFTVLSVISLIALRPIMKKFLDRQKRQTNVDEMVGKIIVLSKACEKHENGEAKFNGLYWTCQNVIEGEVIEEGKEVEILAIQGNKLIVKENK